MSRLRRLGYAVDHSGLPSGLRGRQSFLSKGGGAVRAGMSMSVLVLLRTGAVSQSFEVQPFPSIAVVSNTTEHINIYIIIMDGVEQSVCVLALCFPRREPFFF